MMAVVSIVSDVPYSYVNKLLLYSPLDDALVKRPFKHGWEKSENMYTHGSVSKASRT